MSAAYKYACILAFSIPTEGEDNDADRITQPEIVGSREDHGEPDNGGAAAHGAEQPPSGAPVGPGERPPYPVDWRDHVIHFGPHAGIALKELNAAELEAYQTKWMPKAGANGGFNEKSLLMRDALDASIKDPTPAAKAAAAATPAARSRSPRKAAKAGETLPLGT